MRFQVFVKILTYVYIYSIYFVFVKKKEHNQGGCIPMYKRKYLISRIKIFVLFSFSWNVHLQLGIGKCKIMIFSQMMHNSINCMINIGLGKLIYYEIVQSSFHFINSCPIARIRKSLWLSIYHIWNQLIFIPYLNKIDILCFTIPLKGNWNIWKLLLITWAKY